MIGTAHQIVLPVVLPLLAAFLLPLVGRLHVWPARLLGQIVGVLHLAVVAYLWTLVGGGETIVSALGGFAPPLGIVLYADRLSVLFLLVLSVGILLFWPRREHGGTRADTLTLLLLGGGSGLVLSGDLFNIFVFYEIVAVASYGLAASGGNAAGFGAALRYLLLSALGSALALLGIALVYGAAGTLNLADLSVLAPERLSGPMGLAAFLLLVLGFGVKAELFPVNTWVPEVYTAAPTRVTAILAGVVSKLSMVVILRLLVLIFADPGAQTLLLVLGLAGVIAGELAAFRAPDLNRTFAFSSIAQLGLVAVAFSIPDDLGIAAGIAVAVHHAVVKPGLFVIAGHWTGPIERLGGAARVSRPAAIAFVLLSLSIIGIPPFPGFWVKLLLLGEAFAAVDPVYALAGAVILAATVVEAAYLFRAAALMWEPPEGDNRPPAAFPLARLAPTLVLTLLILLAMGAVSPLGEALEAMAAEVGDAAIYVGNVLPGRI